MYRKSELNLNIIKMKRVTLMTLNNQQVNYLSKEERKKVLGGAPVCDCYVVCWPYGRLEKIYACNKEEIESICGSPYEYNECWCP